jgi:hypothetical protein
MRIMVAPWAVKFRLAFQRRRNASFLAAAVAATALMIAAMSSAQPLAAARKMVLQANPPANAQQKSKEPPRGKAPARQPRKGTAHPSLVPAKAAQTAAAAPPPPPPPPPNWPVNDPPQQASVTWSAQGLSIDARNSSLQQILSEISGQTGAKVEGLGKDERVFGIYGPGNPRDVLSQLLEGTGYNVIMAGDGERGAPQQIVLSEKPEGGPQPNSPVSQGDMYEPPLAPYEPTPTTDAPNQVPRTPQQIMQEMQQRQQMIREQQQLQQRESQQQQSQ